MPLNSHLDPRRCTRCERTCPPGTTVSACCGVPLYNNGPPPPGTYWYDALLVDQDVAALHQRHEDAMTAHAEKVEVDVRRRIGHLQWWVIAAWAVSLAETGLLLGGVHF